MKLTKDTLIEGVIYKEGREVNIQEKEINHDNETVTMTRDEYQKTNRDYKGEFGKDKFVLAMNGKRGTIPYKVIFSD